MDLPVIKIGNSRGIRLSKTILEKYQIREKVELLLEEDCIVLKPKVASRQRWDDAFKKAGPEGEGEPLIPDVFEDETFEE